MKKLLKLLPLIAFVVSAGTLFHFDVLLAQDSTLIAEAANQPPEVIRSVFMDWFGKFFLTTMAFATMATAVSYWLISKIKALQDAPGFWKQTSAIVVAIALSAIGKYFDAGIFGDMTFIAALTHGLNVGLNGNGIFDWITGAMKLNK